MTARALPDIPMDTPVLYEIRVRGALDPTWCALADEMTLEVVFVDDQPVTVARVRVQDQAALAGLLDALFCLNVTVLSVEALEAG
jgi:hypothetical protein